MTTPKRLISLDEKVQIDFLNYANAVIKSRAISSVEDNLKPVHRRILYTMAENGLWSNKKTIKSANVVGLTMIRHPHGDSSIYDAMVRLSQPWKMRYPLIEMQGNSGNILGDGPAAMRYTEARLSKYGELLLENVKENSVPFKLSYDESAEEPVYLPSKFPNILCNGNSGIAVGLSANLVPHNLKEVANAINAYIQFKGITVEQLMKHIPAPDFPTGGTIVDAGRLKEIYETGSGTITLRSKYKIEKHGKQDHIIFTEIPYLVNVEDGVIKPLKKLVIEDNFDLIEDYENSTNKNGVNLRIILRKNANVYKVLETLWQNTRLQITQRISNTVIYNGNPHTMNLKEMIQHYVDHRHTVIINIAKNSLEKTQHKIILTQGLILAMNIIDDVIAIIKAAKNKDNARTQLIAKLGINEIQANAILDMRLSKLNQLEASELQAELDSLQKKEKELQNTISNEKVRDQQIQKELLEMSGRYGDERRTILSYATEDGSEGFPVEPIKILMFENGATFATQQKISDLDMKKKTSELNSSPVRANIDTKTDRVLTVFTNDGTLHEHKVLTMATEMLELAQFNAAPVAAFDLNDTENLKDYLVFVTSGGLVKKTRTSEYLNAKNNSRTIRLKGNQELIFVGMANDDDNVLVLNGKMTFFKVKDITQSGKYTVGSKGIASNGATSAAIISNKEKVLMISSDGKGKLTKASDFVQSAKGSNGQVVAENSILLHKESSEYFIYANGKNHYITTNPLTKGKTAIGSKVVSGDPISIAF